MSYENHTWETGEVITAAKLNTMEDGIDDKLIVTMLGSSTGELDASYADLLAAWNGKKQVLLYDQITVEGGIELHHTLSLSSLFIQNGTYTAVFGSVNYMNGSFMSLFFNASTESEHMVYVEPFV